MGKLGHKAKRPFPLSHHRRRCDGPPIRYCPHHV